MDYFSADVETSGPAPGLHNLLSIGVTHVRRVQGQYRLHESFYLELRPEFPRFEEKAMEICGLDADKLKREGIPPKDAMQRLANWVKAQQKSPKERPVFVAHNAPFDWMFVVYYFEYYGVANPFGHSAIDLKALAMGQLRVPWNQTSLRLIAAQFGELAPRDLTKLHHAGEDARYQAEVFSALMNRRSE